MTPDMARELFVYEAESGKLLWKNPPKSHGKAGQEAGWLGTRGYREVGYGKRKYLVHRIIWAMVHGVWPDRIIDHANGNPLDNRICNLRFATRAQNTVNSNAVMSSSGFRGVTLVRNGKFQAKIKVSAKTIYLGRYETAEEASEAYRVARVKYWGEFSPT